MTRSFEVGQRVQRGRFYHPTHATGTVITKQRRGFYQVHFDGQDKPAFVHVNALCSA